MNNLLIRLRQYAQHGVTAAILIILIYSELVDGVTIDIIEAGYLAEVLTLLNVITVATTLSISISVYQFFDGEHLIEAGVRAYETLVSDLTLLNQFSPVVYINAP
ncbi:MAG: hypothetical protein RIC35_16935 [Marinoscillum sp.]